jgi:hypothetical protein
MKPFYTTLTLLCAWYVLTSSQKDPDNPPPASTGAPSEKTCMQAKCHTQGTPTGTVTISGLPEKIAPNTTYQITIKNNSTNGKGTGFQMTCLDANNAACGTFSTATGVSIGVENGRSYPRNSKKTQLLNGAASWTFPWKSPATISNPKITFYYSSIFGNGDGKENNDGIFTGSTSVNLSTPTIDLVLDAAVSIFPNPTSEILHIDLKGAFENAEAYITNATGQQIQKIFLDRQTQLNVSDYPKGIYQLQIWADKRFCSKRIVIN